MKLVWTPEAEQDCAVIWDYLRARNPGAALRMDRLFSPAAARLAEFPLAGREGSIAGTHEVSHYRNDRIVNEIADETVWILVLIHAARQWPPVRERGAHADYRTRTHPPHRLRAGRALRP